MNEALHIVAATTGERLDLLLAKTWSTFSRSFWQARCSAGFVVSDGKPRKSSYLVSEGEEFSIIMPEKPDFSEQSIPKIYQDDDVIALNKPTGILTHAKGAFCNEFSVAEFVRPLTTDNPTGNRPGIVHRLDRGTSGVIITARTSEAKSWLQKQFSSRKVKKSYVALLQGHLKDPSAKIDLPIERNPRKPQTFRVGSNGKSAITDYETIQVLPNHTLVRFFPLTGRTHQLRVHAAYLGHPIVGDAFYGKPEKKLNRLFLHASTLEITLPSKERKVFEAPLPNSLKEYIKNAS